MVNRTRLKARYFDRARRRAGHGDTLVLVTYELATGYSDVKTVTSGWFRELVDDPAIGPEVFEVSIAEVDEMTPTLATVFAGKLTHLHFNEAYYQIQGAVKPPTEATLKIWKVRCSTKAEA